jgi:hypothetical protein
MININLKSFFRKFIRKAFTYAPDTELSQKKSNQLTELKRLNVKFTKIYDIFNNADCQKYILNTWEDYNLKFIEMCAKGLPLNFLHFPVVLETLTANPVINPIWKPFLSDLKREAPQTFLEALEEDLLGSPRICHSFPLTSPGRIIHGWTLLQFLKATNAVGDYKRHDLNNIIEYGGGYGGLCTIWRRLNPEITYTIIDTPIMLTIQWVYLSSIFGEDLVHIIKTKQSPVLAGKINLMPVAFIDRNDLQADVFVSTWALSESIALAQETIINLEWYNAKHLILAFQKPSPSFPFAGNFREAAILRGGEICELPYMFEGDSSAIFI